MKTIRLANIITNDVLNGEGICTSVWLQGCPHRCLGCHNPQTWDFNEGTVYYQEQIINNILSLLSKNGIKRNLSILGGEPLCKENIDFTLQLAEKVKQTYSDILIYCWTGYTEEELKKNYNLSEKFKNIDVLIEGRFILKQRDITLKWRGSSNQHILYKNIDF